MEGPLLSPNFKQASHYCLMLIGTSRIERGFCRPPPGRQAGSILMLLLGSKASRPDWEILARPNMGMQGLMWILSLKKSTCRQSNYCLCWHVHLGSAAPDNFVLPAGLRETGQFCARWQEACCHGDLVASQLSG